MPPNPRQTILLKELDLLQDSVKNLDDIIFKNKNFAFLIWGGAVFLIVDQLSQNEALKNKIPGLIYATALIPLVFWIAHVFWQKHLHFLAVREKKIAYFINSPAFAKWCEGDTSVQFPVYDIVGWIFTVENKKQEEEEWAALKFDFPERYLVDRSEFSWWKTLWYKDAKVYYLLMMLLSVAFGFLYNS